MSDLLQNIVANHIILTVNSRLSRHLMQVYEQWQIEQGNSQWETPNILPWSAWLKQLWQQQTFDLLVSGDSDVSNQLPQLLSDMQAQVLWEQAVRNSEQGADLLNVTSTAKAAQSAWRLLKQWQLPLSELDEHQHLDTQAFHAWAHAFEALCSERNLIDEASLPDYVANMLDHDVLAGQSFRWVGFDELTPQHQALISAQNEAGGDADVLDLPLHESQTWLHPCADSKAEIEAAAQWVRELLDQGQKGPIGIVVPDLAGLRSDIVRIFDEVLTPPAVADLTHAEFRPYNISLGTALSELPMIHSALNLLSLMQGHSPLHKWSQFILSPFFRGAKDELAARAKLDARLRKHAEANLKLRQVLYWADRENGESGDDALAQFIQILVSLREYVAQLSDKLPAASWSECLQKLLQIAGWPGERELDSEGFQTGQAWKTLLIKLGSLDSVLPPLSYNDVLRYVRQLASSTLFQPQNRGEPVQVLGVLEAVGVEFSHCWVMGLHDGVWPPAPQPNSFLPIELQRKHQMPHATAERELAYIQSISARLFCAAPEVIISYPEQAGDAELRASPLVSEFPQLPQRPWMEQVRVQYRQQQYAQRALESFADWQAPPLNKTQAYGGTSIFRDQAACPFRAFARHRLGAEGLAEPVNGLDPAERGNLVHSVLEQFWQQVKDQSTLNDMSDDGLAECVAEVVQRVIAAEAEMFPQVFTERFSLLEQRRLNRLIYTWLLQEREREDFSVVGIEAERSVEIGGFKVTAKADRIDRLASGGEMVIDYKTGDPKVYGWFGERPDEPQLPLYAVTHDKELSGVAFARLNPAGCGFRGFSRHASEGKGIVGWDDEKKYNVGKEDWSQLLDEWRKVLTALAESFRRGDAQVDPKDGSKTCVYCECAPLCRINEMNGLGLDDEASMEADDE